MSKSESTYRSCLVRTYAWLPALLVALAAICIGYISASHRAARESARLDHVADLLRSGAENSLSSVSRLAKTTAANLAAVLSQPDTASGTVEIMIAGLADNDAGIRRAWLMTTPETPDAGATVVSFSYHDGEIRTDTTSIPQNGIREKQSLGLPFFLGKPFFAASVGENAAKEPLGSVSYPVAANGKTLAVFGVEFDYGRLFSATLRSAALADTTMILAENGDMLLSAVEGSNAHNVTELFSDRAEKQKIADMLALRRPVDATLSTSTPSTVSRFMLRPVPVSGTDGLIQLCLKIPEEAIGGGYRSAALLAAILGLLCLVAVAAYHAFASARLAQPVCALSKAAERLADGGTEQAPGELTAAAAAAGGRVREFNALGRSLAVVGEKARGRDVLQDALARTEAENREIVDVSKRKERFFANMSHEIRTPMNAILGMSELLLAEPINDAQRGYVRDIKMASESLLGIINDILDLSKFESGKLSLVNVDYDLSLLIENICSMTFFLAKEKKLNFEYSTEGDIPRYLFGDETRLRQVLLNILGNAIKFTRKGSVRLKVADEGDMLRFAVSDTGIGIREEDIGGLFEAFKQLDEEKNRKIKGTGLGLSISFNLVKIMGGAITVDSVYGEGTTFHIRIPKTIGDGAKVAEGEDDGDATFSTTAKVLVVDDNEVNLKVALGLMKLNGVTCETASSGAEAITKVKTENYAVIFMDHMMPDMDGLEVTRRIRALGPEYADTPIVALTANAVVGMKEVFLAAGMNDFLSKPIEKAKLRSILVKWMPRAGGTTRIEFQAEAADPTTFLGMPGGQSGSILQMAKRIDGLDIATGLSRVSGQQDLYEEILHLAGETIPSIIETILTAYGNGDVDRLTIEVHGAKGSLATIGAMKLSEEAAALEKACKVPDMDFVEINLPGFLEGMQRLCDSIQSLFSLFVSPATILYGDFTQLQARLHKLDLALRNQDGENIQKIIKSVITRDFGEHVNKHLANLKEKIDRKEYADAIKYINSFISELSND